MERLRAALDKARATREGNPPAQVPARGPAPQAPARSESVAAAWHAIQQVPSPRLRRTRRHRLVTLSRDPDAAAYDVLRTRVLQLTKANGWRRIAITSPLNGSGKTTTTINLAISLARQVDLRIIVLDLDLRRPAIARALGLSGKGNTADIFRRGIGFGAHAHRMGENLAFAANFSVEASPSDLLLRAQTAEVIDDIERDFAPDLMLFDLPPMLAADDASAFFGKVDCGLLVAEAGTTTVPQIDSCEKQIADQTNVLGIVLNKCRIEWDGSDYSYGYT